MTPECERCRRRISELEARAEAADEALRELGDDYDALVIAAGNTFDDGQRYFLAWQSARRRAARLRDALKGVTP